MWPPVNVCSYAHVQMCVRETDVPPSTCVHVCHLAAWPLSLPLSSHSFCGTICVPFLLHPISAVPQLPPPPLLTPDSTCHLAARPSISVSVPALPAACHPRPLQGGGHPVSLSDQQPLSWAGRGIPPGSWKKQLGPRERPSVSPRPGVSPRVGRPEAGSSVVSGCAPRPPDLAPAPQAPPTPRPTAQILFRGRSRWQQEETGLKEAFRAARPGASCPPAWASGRPSGDLRWPVGWGVGGPPPWCLVATGSAGVGRCDPHPRDSRQMSSMEKYHGQTWDAWMSCRTSGPGGARGHSE